MKKLVWNRKYHKSILVIFTVLNYINAVLYWVLDDNKDIQSKFKSMTLIICIYSFFIIVFDILVVIFFLKAINKFVDLIYKQQCRSKKMIITCSYVLSFMFFLRSAEYNIYLPVQNCIYAFNQIEITYNSIRRYSHESIHKFDYFLHINSNVLTYAISFMVLAVLDQLGLNNTTLYDALEDLSDVISSDQKDSFVNTGQN